MSCSNAREGSSGTGLAAAMAMGRMSTFHHTTASGIPPSERSLRLVTRSLYLRTDDGECVSSRPATTPTIKSIGPLSWLMTTRHRTVCVQMRVLLFVGVQVGMSCSICASFRRICTFVSDSVRLGTHSYHLPALVALRLHVYAGFFSSMEPRTHNSTLKPTPER